MSIASLPRWQSTLFSIAQFASAASHLESDIPISVIITTMISSIVYCQFQYMNGSVNAALAVLRAPNYTSTYSTHTKDVPELENGRSDQTERIIIDPKDTLEEMNEMKEFVRTSKQQILVVVPATLGGYGLGFAFDHLWYNPGADNLQKILFALPWVLVFGALSIGAPNANGSHAVTPEQNIIRCQLYNRGRFWFKFPGLDFFAVYMFLALSTTAMATCFAANENLSFPVLTLTKVLVGLFLTNLHTAWVHVIISKPNGKSFWQRIPGWEEWIQTVPAAFLDLALPKCTHYLTQNLLRYHRESFLPGLMYLPPALEFLISILTRAIYIRVSASLLPDDDETIIPFDPSFGGRARNNGTHCLSILDAIRSMRLQNWHQYRNIVLKTLQFELVFVFLFIITIAFEFYLEKTCTAGDLLVLFASMFLVE